jgi:hypothetical protein
MTDFIYVLSYNTFGENPSEPQVQAFLGSHRDINTWYRPFFGTFIFKSPKLLRDLAPNFRQFFGNSACVLTYANPALMGGSLPQSVWDWINGDPPPVLTYGS